MSKGFQYYKLDTNRYEDIRIRKLRRAYGTKGIAVYDFLLARIYRVEGCYTVCDEECIFSIVDYFDIREDVVNEIIGYCGAVGLFDKDLLSRGNVVTSHAIQRRYAEMCKAAKRPYVDIPKDFILVTEQELGMKILLSDFSGKNEKIPEKYHKLTEKSQKLQSNNDSTGNSEKIDNSENNGENSGKISEIPGIIEKNPEPEKRKERTKEKENKSIKSKVEAYSKEYVSGSPENSGSPDASSSSVPPIEKENFIISNDEIDFDEIVEFWNATTCCVFGKLICIDKSRAKMTRARIIDHGKDSFFQAIRNAAESVFLRSVTWFSYDWMIRPNNFIKVLEGRYSNRETQNNSGCVTENGKEKNVKPVRQRVYD